MRLFGKRIESFFGGRTSLKAFWNRRMIYCQSNGRDSENSFSTSPLSLSRSLLLSHSLTLSLICSHTHSLMQANRTSICVCSHVYGIPLTRTHPHPRTPKLIKNPNSGGSIQDLVLNLSGFISPQIAIWLSVMVPRTCLDGLPSRVTVLPSGTLYP